MDPRAARAAAELVEVVSGDGAVERVVTRAQMRAEGLRHRCTYIAVLDDTGRLVVHRRAWWKDIYPGYWEVAFGGVVGVGESWDEAAARELAEEAGVHAPLELLHHSRYDEGTVHVLGAAYLARHDGPFRFADGEVIDHARVPLEQVRQWAAQRDVCPDSLAFVAPLLDGIAPSTYGAPSRYGAPGGSAGRRGGA